jgi:O-methyltransferase involved in polyketide biosynthesis
VRAGGAGQPAGIHVRRSRRARRPDVVRRDRAPPRALATAGERWTFGLDPGEVPAFLAARGLALEQDVGATEYRRRCFGPAAARMAGYEFYRIVVARVR